MKIIVLQLYNKNNFLFSLKSGLVHRKISLINGFLKENAIPQANRGSIRREELKGYPLVDIKKMRQPLFLLFMIGVILFLKYNPLVLDRYRLPKADSL